jgi:hypothetical protein
MSQYLLVGKVSKKRGGIKMHTLFDIVTQIRAFIHITAATGNDIQKQVADRAVFQMDKATFKG